MKDLPGEQLGNYRLIQLLGKGGFAAVYLGEHCYLKSYAALKVLQISLSEKQVQRFQTEAQTLVRLRHPNIIRVLEFFVEQGVPVLVMEYAPNGTLLQRHPKGTLVSLPTIVSYIQQVASALQYIHDRRLIHRDIKPANLLIGEQDQILLSDFGLVTASHSSLSLDQEEMAGSLLYMSPEQIIGLPRPASDQYSLGVVVYEWLCGSRPFQGPMFEVMRKHQMASPPPLSEKVPTISLEVEKVVMRTLAKDPRQRFDSVLEFAHALERASLSASESITVTLPSVLPLSESTSSEPRTVLESIAPASTSVKERVPTSTKSRLSRRAVVLGGGTIIGSVVAAGGLIWLTQHGLGGILNPTPGPTPTPSPTPLPRNPLGTLIYPYKEHKNYINAVAWSTDGKLIASGDDDGSVKVWKATDGSFSFSYSHAGPVEAVAWSSDGKRVASGSIDQTVQVWEWDGTSGNFVYTYKDYPDIVYTVAWSPNGQSIALGGDDKTVQVWDATSNRLILTCKGHTNAVYRVVWSPDGNRIASGSFDGTVQVWDATNGNPVLTYRGHSPKYVQGVAWSPDGKYIASGGNDDTVQVWDAASGVLAFTYRNHHNYVLAVAWSPDSKRIVSGGVDKTAQVWDVTSGDLSYTYTGHTDVVKAVAWSPDGRLIASGSDDTTVQVWGAG
jgi:eukaryotic-like serine/threonine-protein kinase